MYDVIIIGGGPAGSTLGCYLSDAGVNNLIIDKTNHPREHVGESLVTNTNRILGELGLLPTMEDGDYVRKYGAAWHAPSSQGTVSIRFAEFPLDGVNQPYTYHVDRGQFDLALLKRAEEQGSKVIQGLTVTRVLFDENNYATGVRVKLGSQSIDLSAKIIVDASGRDTLLGRHLKLKEKDSIFNQYAIHTWYEDVNRGSDDTADFIHIYFLPIERGWVWQIPVTDSLISIGVVAEREYFVESKMDMESFFNEHVRSTPDLVRAMKNARQVRKFTTEGDYSYSLSKVCGDGYVIIGDAARFVDPIFSSGISVAMHSGKFASEVIIKALETNDYREEVFKPYEVRLKSGVEIWYEFIRLYYKLLPLFTYFIKVIKYRIQVHRLLQGEVYDREEAPVLQAMRDYIAKVESNENHVLRQQLKSVPLGDLSFVPDFVEEYGQSEDSQTTLVQ